MKQTVFIIAFFSAAFFLHAEDVVYSDNVWQINKLFFATDNSKPITEPTSFRIKKGGEALHIEVKLEGFHWKKLQETPFTVNQNAWPSEESVEIFLDPGRRCANYVQIAAGVNGTLYDNRMIKKAWGASWSVKREDFKGGVLLHFTIPFDEEFELPEDGDIWGFNICRNVKNGSPYFSTFAKIGSVFNNPSKFAELRFGTETTFAEACRRKNIEDFLAVESELKTEQVLHEFRKKVADIKKEYNEIDITAIKDELKVIKAMKEAK